MVEDLPSDSYVISGQEVEGEVNDLYFAVSPDWFFEQSARGYLEGLKYSGDVIENFNQTTEEEENTVTFNWDKDANYTVNGYESELIHEVGDVVVYKWGIQMCMVSVFNKDTGEMVHTTNGGCYFPLVVKSLYEHKDIYDMSFAESGLEVQEGLTGKTSIVLFDGRNYGYTCRMNRGDRSLFSISAGCRNWLSFNEARAHYDEYYTSDGNRHEVLTILNTLEKWHNEIMKEHEAITGQTPYQKALSSRLNGSSSYAYGKLESVDNGKGFEFTVDGGDPYQKIKLYVGIIDGGDDNGYWLRKTEAEVIRDFLTEALNDWD